MGVVTPGTLASARRRHGGPSPYVAQAVHFNGDSFLTQDAMSISDSPYFLLSGWFKIPTDAFPLFQRIYSDGFAHSGTETGPYWNAPRDVFAVFGGYPALPDPEFKVITADGAWSYETWTHFAIYGDTNHSAGQKIGQICIGGVRQIIIERHDLRSAFEQTFNGAHFSFPFYGNDTLVDIADYQVWVGVQTDLSDPANIANLISGGKPVDPATAALAFGEQTFLFSGDSTTFPVNQGMGGAFTLIGSLTNASSSPSD